MARVVLDPNVLISGLISRNGPSARILLELRAAAIELITSPVLLAELENVLLRQKFRRNLSIEEVRAFVGLVRAESTVIDDPTPPADPLCSDPGDEYLIRLARSVRADALVSGDPHLTRLRNYIPVRSPAEFLRQLDAVG